MATNTYPRTRRGVARREQILRSAEVMIGEQGFTAASIADITRHAKTALGTFYIYFSGKEDVFRELVLEMGQLTRAVITKAVADAPNRLEAERAGLSAFLRFVAERPSLYRIVEEARFIDADAYKAYFTSFAKAYAAQLAEATEAGELRPGDPEVRAWALMGIAKILGERYVIWEGTSDIDEVVDKAFAMIRDGLSP